MNDLGVLHFSTSLPVFWYFIYFSFVFFFGGARGWGSYFFLLATKIDWNTTKSTFIFFKKNYGNYVTVP